MTNFLFPMLGAALSVLGIWLVYDLKQRTRMPPDKDGFRAPNFHIFGETGKLIWGRLGIGLMVVTWLIALALAYRP